MPSLVVLALVTGGLMHKDHEQLMRDTRQEISEAGHVSASNMEALEQALLEEPEEVELLSAYGYALLPKRPEEAVTQLEKAMRIAEKQRMFSAKPLFTAVVTALVRLNRLEDAAAAFARYGYPLEVPMHQQLALRLAQNGSQASVLHAEESTKLAPLEPTSHLCLGLALLTTPGAQKKASAALRKAFDLRYDEEQEWRDSSFPGEWPPELEATARHQLGMLVANDPPEPEENSQLQEALDHFMEAVRLLPKHEAFKESLNNVYTAMFRRRTALEARKTGMQKAAVVDENVESTRGRQEKAGEDKSARPEGGERKKRKKKKRRKDEL